MTEAELIHQAQQGVTSCFTQLVVLYQPKIHSFLLARCNNPSDADDVMQETFINAHRYIKSYDDRWAFSTWLFTIAKRQLSRLKPKPHISLDEVSEPVDEGTELSDNIWPLVKQHLGETSHDLLWFFYVEGMSIKDLSQVMNQSTSWVKTNLHRSKMKLSHVPAIQQMMGK